MPARAWIRVRTPSVGSYTGENKVASVGASVPCATLEDYLALRSPARSSDRHKFKRAWGMFIVLKQRVDRVYLVCGNLLPMSIRE